MSSKPTKRSKKGGRRKKKDPHAPKRPRSAYIIYCTEQRPHVKAELGSDAKPADLMKRMGDMWNGLSTDKKKEYNDKAKEDKERYNGEMKSYHPPEADSDDDEPPRKRGKRRGKKRDPNEPKRAPSAYLLYGQKVREQVKTEHPDAKSSQIMQIIGQMWQKLGDEEKKPFNDQASELKAKYDKDKSDYKKNKSGGGGRYDEEEQGGDAGSEEDGGEEEENEDDDGGDDDDEEEDDDE